MKVLIVFPLLFATIFGFPSFSVVDEKLDSTADLFSIQNRIAGGESATPGQFPFQVAIQRRREVSDKYVAYSFCGGVLISDELVLTAAHCVVDGTSAKVTLGVTDLQEHGPNGIVIRVPGENLITHENYRNRWLDNDIALIKLPYKIKFNEYVQPVNLPRLSQMNATFEKMIGWISGWGRISDDNEVEKTSTSVLKYARRWILPPEYCKNAYGGYFTKEIHVCIDGSYKTSACSGDSGGPLTVVEEDGSRTLVGVTSYGKREGCEKGFPTAYTRVSRYLHWIAEKGGIQLRN